MYVLAVWIITRLRENVRDVNSFGNRKNWNGQSRRGSVLHPLCDKILYE